MCILQLRLPIHSSSLTRLLRLEFGSLYFFPALDDSETFAFFYEHTEIFSSFFFFLGLRSICSL
jgi:hypothetical protein